MFILNFVVSSFILFLESLDWFVIYAQDATQKSQKAFVHVASEIGAYEAEEIGMYHIRLIASPTVFLLRDSTVCKKLEI